MLFYQYKYLMCEEIKSKNKKISPLSEIFSFISSNISPETDLVPKADAECFLWRHIRELL